MNADGTQEPDPPVSFPDPLAGLGSDGWRNSGGRGDGDDVPDIEIAQPVAPDPDLVREMVDAATGDSETTHEETTDPDGPPESQGTRGTAPESRAFATDSDTDTGVRTSTTPLLLGLHRRDGQRTGQGTQEVGRVSSASSAFRRPSSGSAGLIVAVTLLVAFIILAIQLISGIVNSVTGIFG